MSAFRFGPVLILAILSQPALGDDQETNRSLQLLVQGVGEKEPEKVHLIPEPSQLEILNKKLENPNLSALERQEIKLKITYQRPDVSLLIESIT